MTKTNEVRANLYIANAVYDDYWKENKKYILKAVEEAERLNCDYCFGSDLQSEEKYQEELNKKVEVIKNINGIVLFNLVNA